MDTTAASQLWVARRPRGRLGRLGSRAAQVAVLLVVFSVGIAWGLMINSQVASAELGAATSDDFTLHICEPGDEPPLFSPATPESWCLVDDAGGAESPGEVGTDPAWRDELIFDDAGPLTPGGERSWDVRLVNAGDGLAWDLWSFDVTFAEVDDPGDDCDAVPDFVPNGVRILGVVHESIVFPDGNTQLSTPPPNQDNGAFSYLLYNDNHEHAVEGTPEGAIQLLSFAGSQSHFLHVEPGHYEDLRLAIFLPDTAGNECLDTRWTMAVQFNVATHA